ncbi:MAG: hypothetical protein KDC44_03435, partial [Phaeodactylibacter sp.]|nr:hypothetical protein [Phaeodactylibacter sp.]
MKNKISLSLFGLCLGTQLVAQAPFTCTEALEICGSNSVLIDYPEAYTETPTAIAEDCSGPFPTFFALDSNIVWLKLAFETSGEFYFTLDPVDPEDDLDFVVFEAPMGDCSELVAARCMYSGENIGAPSSQCLGATGLAPGSTDLAEGPGCSAGDDNFLAPIEVEAGAIVYVLVASW